MLKGRNGYRRTGVLRDRLLTRAKACRGGGRGQIKQTVVGERRKERMGEGKPTVEVYMARKSG